LIGNESLQQSTQKLLLIVLLWFTETDMTKDLPVENTSSTLPVVLVHRKRLLRG
jgi:hypothetical protein